MPDKRRTPRPESERVNLPPRSWRVVFWEGFGWPECERRERSTRRFDNPGDVGRFLEALARWPDHHSVIGVWETACAWVPVDPALLLEVATAAPGTDDE